VSEIERFPAPDDPSDQKYIVPGLQRGLQILRAFTRDRPEIGAPEIAKKLNIPRSTVFRLMQTLEHMGFLERVEKSNDYRLGAAVLSIGFEYLASLGIAELARPILEKLRDETGFSAHLAIRDGRDVVFVVKAPTYSAIASSVTIGTRLPAHGTILGRMILQDMSDAELGKLFPDVELAQFSAQTPTTLDDLKQVLAADRERGYAISEAFFEHGIASVAAPVRDGSNRVVASINITFQNGKVDPAEIQSRLVDLVLAAASDISRRMDYDPERNSQSQIARRAG
jgi:DNA-binding IclR family transcriptional regulator